MAVTRIGFDRSLQDLQHDILKMGALVEESIANTIMALTRQDIKLADEVLTNDDLVDQMEMEIENTCLTLIATQQPMARDLRKIGAGFKIINDLERMADYACDIAKITKKIAGEPFIKPLIDIPRMAEIARLMAHNVLDAYVAEDAELAITIGEKDHEVDHLHNQIFRELLVFMMQDPRTITQATYLLFVSRYLERIGDHAVNIAENVIYLVTGERKNLND